MSSAPHRPAPPRVRRGASLLPALFTIGNLFLGFWAMVRTIHGQYAEAAPLIFWAILLDVLDGRIARMTGTTSEFGAELDSLCDAVSFGAAPAFLLLQLGPGWDHAILHRLLAAVATLYLMCTILRLARYNVESLDGSVSAKRFRGLPSPAAAGCVAALAILRSSLGDRWSGYELAFEGWATAGAFLVALHFDHCRLHPFPY